MDRWGWGFGIGFGFLNFFTSHYLNAEVDSKRRATVLSFKGLALNVGFGAISIIYGGILRMLRDGEAKTAEASSIAFRESLHWLPWIFLLFLALFLIYFFRKANRVLPEKYIHPRDGASS